MAENTPIEKKVVFALAEADDGGPPIVTLGIPRAAWIYMRDGKTHTFDLQSAGVPIRLILFGAKDHADAVRVIEQAAAKGNITLEDRRREDFSIKPSGDNDDG